MINANELRLGNALEYLVEDCVDNSSEWMLNIVDTADIVDAASNESIFNKYYRPIPLTPEILEKCGFVRNNTACYFGLGNYYIHYQIKTSVVGIAIINDDDNLDADEELSVDLNIQYLHQLQNLYWCLCRKELEINLQ